MALNHFLDRDKKKGGPSHRRSKKQERELAVALKGRTTLASGAFSEKGDVRVRGVVRVEAKTTMHKSFSVTLDMIGKIEDAALSAGEVPVIVVEFNDGKGKKIKEVAIVPTYALDQLGLHNV